MRFVLFFLLFSLQSLAYAEVMDSIDKLINSGAVISGWTQKLYPPRPQPVITGSSSKSEFVGVTEYKGGGFLIEAPLVYGEKTFRQALDYFKTNMPSELYKVFFEGAPIPQKLSVSVDVWNMWKDTVLHQYKLAVRFKNRYQTLEYFKYESYRDVRSLYFLGKYLDLDDKLIPSKFIKMNENIRKKIDEDLIGICRNSYQFYETCKDELNRYANAGNRLGFKQKYLINSQVAWLKYFQIGIPNTGAVRWDAKSRQLIVKVNASGDRKIDEWLAYNVEDEYKSSKYKLKLKVEFTQANTKAVNIQFKPGALPSFGNNTIYLDSNLSFRDGKTSWTIRHEFGHALGFPDCYTEFYDSQEEVFVQYHLDLKDIMCSPGGKANDRIFTQLLQAYAQ